MTTSTPRPLGWGRSLRFASGDFACNLYWQSITFYLLFFYTDTLGLSAATAGMVTLVASVWDGLAGLAIGVAADRRSTKAFVRYNALPLALSYILIYLIVPLHGPWLAGFALLAHMLFRTLYVAVNVPYAALTVQIAPDSGSRSRIAGLRMILGAAAALVVAIGTQTAIGLLPRIGYAIAAAAFGVVASVTLWLVSTMRAAANRTPTAREVFDLRQVWRVIAGNRAFGILNLGICGGVAAMAVLTRGIPYYFKYEVGDVAAGSATLAMMSVAGVLAIPLWMACATRLGHRLQWQISSAVAAVALIGLLLVPPSAVVPAQVLFILFQAGGQGLFFGFWALIPDVVEHGGEPGSVRMDTFLFGIAALVQKVTMGIAVAIFGGLLSASGYVADAVQTPRVLEGLIWLTAALPLVAVVGSALAMIRFPRLPGHAR